MVQFPWVAVFLHFGPPLDFEYQKCKFEIPTEMVILNTFDGLVFWGWLVWAINKPPFKWLNFCTSQFIAIFAAIYPSNHLINEWIIQKKWQNQSTSTNNGQYHWYLQIISSFYLQIVHFEFSGFFHFLNLMSKIFTISRKKRPLPNRLTEYLRLNHKNCSFDCNYSTALFPPQHWCFQTISKTFFRFEIRKFHNEIFMPANFAF